MDEMTDAELVIAVASYVVGKVMGPRLEHVPIGEIATRLISIADRLESPWVSVEEFMKEPFYGHCWAVYNGDVQKVDYKKGWVFDAFYGIHGGILAGKNVTYIQPILKPIIPPIEDKG